MPSQQQKNKLRQVEKQKQLQERQTKLNERKKDRENSDSDEENSQIEAEDLKENPEILDSQTLQNKADLNDSNTDHNALQHDKDDELQTNSPQNADDKMAAPTVTSADAVVKYPLTVLYCDICSMPIEYCMYSPTFTQCKAWLQKTHVQVYECMYMPSQKQLTTADATKNQLITTSADKQPSAQDILNDINCNLDSLKLVKDFDSLETADMGEENGAKKRQTRGGRGMNTVAKMATGCSKSSKQSANASVKVFTAPRGKKKAVTVITGLEDFGIDLKTASKLFATRFSCGASVTAPNEIVIQGDVKDDVIDLIGERWGENIPSPAAQIKDLGIMKR